MSDAKDGQRAYKDGRFADAVRHLAAAALASPADSALLLMLARACERVGWVDLAWHVFAKVEQMAQDPSAKALASQGLASLAKPPEGLEWRLLVARIVDPVRLAQARGEAHAGESALSWLVRQEAVDFDQVVATVLDGRALPPFRHPRERLGMRLLAERRISQGDLKQALSRQAHQERPLGAILVADFGLAPAGLHSVVQAQTPVQAVLGASDAPAALLIRWGALRQEDWEAVKAHGNKAFEVLVAKGQLLASNARRADTYRKLKLRFLAENRFRLGEILVSQGVLDRDTLAKALAWQVDQPYRLGELLIRYRLASAERVVEGLVEQARRYDEAVESMLPPVEHPPPPAPVPLEPTPPPSRRRWVLLGLAGMSLIGALVFATRYTRGDFAWLSAFIPVPGAAEGIEPGVAQMLGGSQSSGPRRERGTAFDPLDLPGSEFTGKPLGETIGGDRVGTRSGEGFVGNRQGGDFLGSPLPPASRSGFVSEGAGLEAVGTPSGEKAVGSSGVTDSVAYARQGSAGSRRHATSREAELQAATRVAYPIQDERHLAGSPPVAAGGRMQAPVLSENQLQAPIGLGRSVDGSPPESIQVRRDTAVFRLRLGRSQFERKDAASAREEFLSAIGLDPTLSPPHYYLGRIADDRGDRELAEKWYRSYLGRTSGGEYSDEVRDRLKSLSIE